MTLESLQSSDAESVANKGWRLPLPYGTYLDRTKPVTFKFDSKQYRGYEGDTIASAVAAAGNRVISRSFKYHRPRGIYSMAGQDGNTLVQVFDEPNVRADMHKIDDGMIVSPQNVFGSLRYDFASLLGLFGRFLPVGFYYKAFYKPQGAWKYWESCIRRIAGLGKVDLTAQPEITDKAYRFADVAVIGGGPAGLNAALAAANAGADVLLIDSEPRLGGSLNYARFCVERNHTSQLLDELVNKVISHKNIQLLDNALCTGLFADNWLSVIQKKRLLKLRTTSIVAATGSFEQPAVFRNNDLPGVMLGSASQRLIRLYGVKTREPGCHPDSK